MYSPYSRVLASSQEEEAQAAMAASKVRAAAEAAEAAALARVREVQEELDAKAKAKEERAEVYIRMLEKGGDSSTWIRKWNMVRAPPNLVCKGTHFVTTVEESSPRIDCQPANGSPPAGNIRRIVNGIFEMPCAEWYTSVDSQRPFWPSTPGLGNHCGRVHTRLSSPSPLRGESRLVLSTPGNSK
eukprot:1194425-Prorocentrum_minimum.AAC.6